MARKNAFNTVTPLSRALSIIIFLLLPFLGFYLGVQYEKSIFYPATLPKSNIHSIINYQIPRTWSEAGIPNANTIEIHSPDYLPPNLSQNLIQGAFITATIIPKKDLNAPVRDNVLALKNPEFTMSNLQNTVPIANQETVETILCNSSGCSENYFFQDSDNLWRVNFQCTGVNCNTDPKYVRPENAFLNSLSF